MGIREGHRLPLSSMTVGGALSPFEMTRFKGEYTLSKEDRAVTYIGFSKYLDFKMNGGVHHEELWSRDNSASDDPGRP